MKKLLLFGVVFAFIFGCNSADPEIDNAYDNQNVGDGHDKVDIEDKSIDPLTIQGLHKNIFYPTCANSGCHDGNFEPDFRTIESSYNTLVGQPIIKNDDNNPLQARVVPGNASTSMLVKRLKEDLNGNSGIMPLLTDPESDWPTKKAEYISNVEAWINNGALDQNGDAPSLSNYPVQLKSIAAKVNGSLLSRSGTYKSINVPSGASSIELWFALDDDQLNPDKLSNLSVDFSMTANDFDKTKELGLTYSTAATVTKGYLGEDESHYHKATLNLSDWNSGDVIWLRVYASDGVNLSETPNDNSIFRLKEYATLKLN